MGHACSCAIIERRMGRRDRWYPSQLDPPSISSLADAETRSHHEPGPTESTTGHSSYIAQEADAAFAAPCTSQCGSPIQFSTIRRLCFFDEPTCPHRNCADIRRSTIACYLNGTSSYAAGLCNGQPQNGIFPPPQRAPTSVSGQPRLRQASASSDPCRIHATSVAIPTIDDSTTGFIHQ